MEKEIKNRSGGSCELCGAAEGLTVLAVAPKTGTAAEECAYLCAACHGQIEGSQELAANHWRCLNDSMWSEVPAVKVLAWRMLQRLHEQSWARDLADILYLEEELQSWAEAGMTQEGSEAEAIHLDSNGGVLTAGDSVVLIKDLPVKGGGFTAKRGTAVRGITLVHDNPEHIEGRINGQKIVILTKFVKKSG